MYIIFNALFHYCFKLYFFQSRGKKKPVFCFDLPHGLAVAKSGITTQFCNKNE